jgi:hypothetical protein
MWLFGERFLRFLHEWFKKTLSIRSTTERVIKAALSVLFLVGFAIPAIPLPLSGRLSVSALPIIILAVYAMWNGASVWERTANPKIDVADAMEWDPLERLYRLRVKNVGSRVVRVRAKLTEMSDEKGSLMKSQLPLGLEWTHHPKASEVDISPDEYGETVSIFQVPRVHDELPKRITICGAEYTRDIRAAGTPQEIRFQLRLECAGFIGWKRDMRFRFPRDHTGQILGDPVRCE